MWFAFNRWSRYAESGGILMKLIAYPMVLLRSLRRARSA
jgi:hypothetical protein